MTAPEHQERPAATRPSRTERQTTPDVSTSPTSLRREAARGVAWTLVERWSERLVATATLIVLARLLAPEDFGLVAFAALFGGVLGILRGQGFEQALIQRERVDALHLDTAWWASIALGAALGGGLFAASDVSAALYGDPRLGDVLRWLSFTVFISGFRSSPAALLRRRLRFRSLALRNVVSTAVGGVAGVTFAVLGHGYRALVYQALVETTVGVLLIVQQAKWRPRLAFSVRHFKELFSFGVGVTGTSLLGYATRHVDDLLIGAFLGPVALGQYTVAYRILRMIIELTITAVHQVMFPLLSRLQSNRDRLLQAYYAACRLATALSLPAFLILATLADLVIVLVFGPRWGAASGIMRMLAIGGALIPLLSFNTTALMAAGFPRRALMLALTNTLLSVTAFAVAVPFGIRAVAAAYAVRTFLLVLPVSWTMHRWLDVEIRRVAAPFATTVACGGALVVGALAVRLLIEGATGPSWATLIISTVTGFAAYGLTLWLLQRSIVVELRSLVRAASSRPGPSAR